jgi:pimeloyl-ACP methyl ester carboxylesterase
MMFWFGRAVMMSAAIMVGGAASGCPGFHAGQLPNPPKGSTFVDVGGVHVRYRDQGSGPTVVLIHGFSSSLEIWDPIARRLEANHRVISIDLKGFGWTSRPAGDYSPQAQAELAWKVLEQRGVKDVALVGHSWGASVVLAMALAHPERVRRIALYSAYVFEAQVPSFFRWARLGGLGEMLFTLHYRERIEERVGLAYFDDRFLTPARVDRVEVELARPGAVAAALAAARGQNYTDIERRYRELAQPALLLWGREDLVTPIHFGERLAAELPNSELVVVPRCGHIPMVEAEPRTTRALVQFLGHDVDKTGEGAP